MNCEELGGVVARFCSTYLSLLPGKPWYHVRVVAICAPPGYAVWYGDRKWVRCLAELKVERSRMYDED